MKIKMAMIGLALGGLVASSAAQVPAAQSAQDEYTSYAGPIDSMASAEADALLTRLLRTKKVQGALTALAVEVITAGAELLGMDATARVERQSTDVLFDLAAQ